MDFCCEDIEYENSNISFIAALLFFSADEDLWEFFSNNYHIKKEDFPEINRYSFDKIWNLDRAGRVGHYLNIFEVVDHSTGNPWIDTTNCHSNDYFSWDESTVELLTKSYREAQVLLEKTAHLDALIEANPKEILLEMISLWNTGEIPQKSKISGRQSMKKRLSKINE